MDFTKLQGAGNDFVLVEADDTRRNWSQLAETFCDRRFGIGADGLLLLLPSSAADFRMRVFNSDGSEAEACGNGLRCLVRYIVSRGLLTDSGAKEVFIETVAGVRRAGLKRIAGNTLEIQVGLGSPKFRAGDIPVLSEKGGGKEVDIKSPLSRTVAVNNYLI